MCGGGRSRGSRSTDREVHALTHVELCVLCLVCACVVCAWWCGVIEARPTVAYSRFIPTANGCFRSKPPSHRGLESLAPLSVHAQFQEEEVATGQSWLWVHFCFRPLWEDEMFARQAPCASPSCAAGRGGGRCGKTQKAQRATSDGTRCNLRPDATSDGTSTHHRMTARRRVASA